MVRAGHSDVHSWAWHEVKSGYLSTFLRCFRRDADHRYRGGGFGPSRGRVLRQFSKKRRGALATKAPDGTNPAGCFPLARAGAVKPRKKLLFGAVFRVFGLFVGSRGDLYR